MGVTDTSWKHREMVGVSWKSFFYFNQENGLYMVLFVIGGVDYIRRLLLKKVHFGRNLENTLVESENL